MTEPRRVTVDREDVAVAVGLCATGAGAWLLWGPPAVLFAAGCWVLLMVAVRGGRAG